ncbi:MAG: polyprenyl synthetase family protein [Bacteroidales bacterium]|nr:polyprenyl synthetase family protein [Bacteroidales bacterium]
MTVIESIKGRATLSTKHRKQLWEKACAYVKEMNLAPPLSMEMLLSHTDILMNRENMDSIHRNLVAINMNNAVWKHNLVKVPYNKRILMIPQCLRKPAVCTAEMDELGLICNQCGACAIGRIQEKAEELGYHVLVSEGTTVVTTLLKSGQVQAVVGIGCVASLEKTFPYMNDYAIPGFAIPLLSDGCIATEVDEDWVIENLKVKEEDDAKGTLNYNELKNEVKSWFRFKELESIIVRKQSQTEELALNWLVKGGKRWRPLCMAAVYKSLNKAVFKEQTIHNVAISVECFHKASLIHDDIQDEDITRYNEPTLHHQHGIDKAINIGDFLIGEGYRFIKEAHLPAETRMQLLEIAVNGHRDLCIGQGMELEWRNDRTKVNLEDVIEMYRLKTGTAFKVAFLMGAVTADADSTVVNLLEKISDFLGITYQIADDIEDYNQQLGNHSVLYEVLKEDETESTYDQRKKKAEQLVAYYKDKTLEMINEIPLEELKFTVQKLAGLVFNNTKAKPVK